jgi:hypothetical protein
MMDVMGVRGRAGVYLPGFNTANYQLFCLPDRFNKILCKLVDN